MRAALLLLLYTLTPVATSDEVHIAVAANFKQTAEVINAYFSHHSGHKVTSSSASTGTLHSQIVYGAPFDILLSADSNSPQSLLASGHGVTGTPLDAAGFNVLLQLAGAIRMEPEIIEKPDGALSVILERRIFRQELQCGVDLLDVITRNRVDNSRLTAIPIEYLDDLLETVRSPLDLVYQVGPIE